AVVNDGVLDRVVDHSVVIDVQGASRFTRGRTDATRELGKVVRRMKYIQRAPPFLTVDQVVPIGNDVVDRAAVMAKGNAAVHAACRLHACLAVIQSGNELRPVAHPYLRRLVIGFNALEFQKSSDLAHLLSSGGNLFRVGGVPQFAQCAPIFDRHDFDKLAAAAVPVVQHVTGAEAACVAEVVLNQTTQNAFVGLALSPRAGAVPAMAFIALHLFGVRHHGFEFDHGEVASAAELTVWIPHIGHPTRHARGEVAACAAENHNCAARHIFTTVVAGSFNDCNGTRVAHGETLTRHTIEVGFAFQRTVEHGVAGNDVFRTEAAEIIRGTHNDSATGKALAHVIVGFADQVQSNAVRQEGPKALAGSAVQLNMDCVVRQAFMPIAPCDFPGEHGANAAIPVTHRGNEGNRFAFFQGWLAAGDELVVQRLVQIVILLEYLMKRLIRGHGMKQAAEVEATSLPMLDAAAGVEKLYPADEFLEAAHAQ